MTRNWYTQRGRRIVVAAFVLGACVGCAEGKPVAEVRGRVVCKSGELPPTSIRQIRFEPTADSKAVVRKGASGAINDDGTFELYTRRPGDGVYHGEYAVTFAFYKSAMDHQSPLLPELASSSTTPYHVTVKGDVDDLEFEIKFKK
jgi:hypothetical protein